MEYENDFVDEKPVELDVEGRRFLYKPTTGGDENDWLKDIMALSSDGKTPKIDWGAYNKKKLANILSVPYEKELIQKVITQNKEWKELTTDQKFEFLGKLKPKLFDKIVTAMKNVDEPDVESLKN